MTKTFEPHFKVLPPEQKKIWPGLAPTKKLGFVLYGGTAVALHLGHRTSIDFDFFSDKPLNKESLFNKMPCVDRAEILQDAPNTLTVLTVGAGSKERGVKVSFFGDIRIGRYANPSLTSDGNVFVASLPDLLATKLAAIMNRVEYKDYFDVAEILRFGVKLGEGLSIARAMYPKFQPQECLRTLTYFEGGDLKKLARSDRGTLVEAARSVERLPAINLMVDGLTS